MSVPEVLLQGDHAAIEEWRFVASVRQTMEKRPDLLEKVNFSKKEQRILGKNGIVLEAEAAGRKNRL